MGQDPTQQPPARGWKRPLLRWAARAAMLFALWLALSGHLEVEFLVMGGFAAVVGTAFTVVQFRGTHEGKFVGVPDSAGWLVGASVRFIAYIPWLVWQILVANLHVTYLVLHPRGPIDPDLVEFDTSMRYEHSQVLLAQSITLTPGTVTVDASNGKYLIHCLSRRSREGVEDGAIQRKVAYVFSEDAPVRVALQSIEEPGQVPL